MKLEIMVFQKWKKCHFLKNKWAKTAKTSIYGSRPRGSVLRGAQSKVRCPNRNGELIPHCAFLPKNASLEFQLNEF